MTARFEAARAYSRDAWWRVDTARRRVAVALETLAVLASPAVLYAVLRPRVMAPFRGPDSSIHTGFILDPHDLFVRYQALMTPSARFREAARVGFLVPARVTYLLFGAVPGFVVFRYLLALIAIIPVYLLLKKLYGRAAGFIGIAVLMSSPVLITAWGTDYPDSAAISYLTGGLAALALSLDGGRGRRGWLLLAASLLTMAIWSTAVSDPLVAVLFVVYVGVRLLRDRAGLGRDVALLLASAAAVTGLCAACSGLLFGQFDFITPTVQSAAYMQQPSQVVHWHSSSWRWAPYDPWLLVPPAIAAAFVVVFMRRWRNIGAPQLFVGLAGSLQLLAFVYLQFFGNFAALEFPLFSSMLWSSVNLMLALILAEIARSMLRVGAAEREDLRVIERSSAGAARKARRIVVGVPILVVLAVPLVYESDPHVSAMTWVPWGVAIAAVLVAAAVVGRLAIESMARLDDRRQSRASVALGQLMSVVALVVIVGAALILTVAPRKQHPRFPHTVNDALTAYDTALGGSSTTYLDEYAVDSELPRFVGHAAYRGEQLLHWEPTSEFGDLLGPTGLYHAAFNSINSTFPTLDATGAQKIVFRHDAQLLLMSLTGQHFADAVRSLARFHPVVARRAVLAHGSYHLHVWLVEFPRYLHPPACMRCT